MMMLTTMMTKKSVPAAAAEATTGMRGKVGCGSVMTVLVGEVPEGITKVIVCVCVCGGGGGYVKLCTQEHYYKDILTH